MDIQVILSQLSGVAAHATETENRECACDFIDRK